MSRPQKTWYFLAMVAMLTGLPHLVQAGDDAKAGPKPLPPDVVKALTAAGAEVGWMRPNHWPYPEFSSDKIAPPGAVAAFRVAGWGENTLARLPDPGVPFGLDLLGNPTDLFLKQLAGLKSLQSLHLLGSNVTDVGLKELAGLKGLQALTVGGYPIVTKAWLKELAGLKSLKSLYLHGGQITDAGVKELAGLKGLQALSLFDSRVTAAGLKKLAGLKNLESLH